ncbi:Disease resistance protein RPM1 [Vitis vinifera]|uniref:Disease resistance protein RPM1 n=1 Tax=Vitis vinifera TaxID=29760 RepID=A0A438C7C3_VITVI|nr:Disease resistance protein RPM1 [Vitis vinifera]
MQRGRKKMQGLKTWIQGLRETAYSIEDVIDEYLLHLGNPSQRHRFIGFLCKVGRLIKKLKRHHEIASKIRDIQKKVVKLKKTSSTYGFSSSVQPGSGGSSTSTPWHDPRVTSLFIDDAEIVGIESQKIELTSRLVEVTPERTVISVVGMGGLGKTTLANKIYDNKVLVGHFDCSAWITVSQSFKMEELLRNMSMKFYQARKEPVPEGINTMDQSSLMTLTRQYLQDKRYVVVFDDVWKLDFWGFIKYVLPENKKGSRIIITTRNDEVASSCKESSFDYIHKLQPLPPKSSWKLFCKKAFQGGCPPELEKLSHDIVRRCGGLPLAIVAIGGLLSRKEKLVSEWKKFSDTLGSELQSNSHLESINTILSLSYHDLPYQLKSCFLYFAIFPEDCTIKCRPLTRLWIAEGFVKAKRGVTLEEVAEEFLTELIQRSLVLVSEVFADGKIRSCHVHDLMREIILTKAEELSFCCVMTGEESSFDGRFRRLSLHYSSNNVVNITGKKSHIRSIFLYNSQTFFLGILASKFNLLEVLHLDDSGLDSIPENLGNLLHLRYLSLRNTEVRMLPRSIGVHVKEGIGCLEELQKLSCVEANHGVGVIKELGKLGQLRKLSVSKLTRENGEHLCASITKMDCLKSLFISSLREDEILDLQYISYPPPSLSRLKLFGLLEKLPDWISKLQNLSTVLLYGSNLMNDPMQVLQTLPSLQELDLFRASVIEQLCFEATGFQKLKILRIVWLIGLKRVKIEHGALPQLETLRVGPCPQLEELPPGIRHLTRLTTLEFDDLQEELKLSMIPSRGRNYEIVGHIPNVLFMGLKLKAYES